MKKLTSILLFILGWLGHAVADEIGLGNCSGLFPGNDLSLAPTRIGSLSSEPAMGNFQLCYRTGTTPFFALEYNPGRLTADWVAYKIENSFGETMCGSRPRTHMRCYFRSEDVNDCIETGEARNRWPSDPFHTDVTLTEVTREFLRTNPFRNTRHDRGHLAPNNAFSWHMCGAYKSFTMANMAPQLGIQVNRSVWQRLEQAELFWGVEHGPIHVVTGPTYYPFPAHIFSSADLNRSLIYPVGKVINLSQGTETRNDILLPTGFFKVIYQSEPNPKAIGFLIPHTEQRALDFRDFAVEISAIEQMTGLYFSIPEALKRSLVTGPWLGDLPPRNWSIRGACENDNFQAQHWHAEDSRDDRIAACLAPESP